jgi:hypothetical protein
VTTLRDRWDATTDACDALNDFADLVGPDTPDGRYAARAARRLARSLQAYIEEHPDEMDAALDEVTAVAAASIRPDGARAATSEEPTVSRFHPPSHAGAEDRRALGSLLIAVGTGRLTLDEAARQMPAHPRTRRHPDRRHAPYNASERHRSL